MSATAHLKQLPLRQRKSARTRLELVEALVEALRTRPFEEITIRSLCTEVGVSEPTFFKYFPRKEDPLVLFVQLWSIGLAAKSADPALSGRQVVAMIFDETARQMKRAPRVMHEIIAHQMRSEDPPDGAPPSRAELMMHFEGAPAAWDMKPVPVQTLIGQGLGLALERREIAADTCLTDATWTLVSIFFGVPATSRSSKSVARRYRRALETVWLGLGGQEQAS